MTTLQTGLERITAGLPNSPVSVPASIETALQSGVIKESDLAPNMYAHIRASHPIPAEVQPPLDIKEELARGTCIRAIAQASISHLIEPSQDEDPAELEAQQRRWPG